MSLMSLVEMHCEHCGHADYYHGANKAHANNYFKSVGYIVRSNGTHFCNEDCEKKYKLEQEGAA